MNLELTATGVTRAGRRIDLLAERARDPRAAFERITDELTGAERRLFSTGRGMRDIRTSTVQRKSRDPDPRVRMNSYRTMVATGALRQYLTTRGSGAQPWRLSRDELGFGLPRGRTGFYYARLQAKRGRNAVVPRRTVARVSRPIIRDFLLGG